LINTVKLLVVFLVTVFCNSVYGLDLYGVYTGSCLRDVGTILDVRDQAFDILTLDGSVKTLARYQANYLAIYPIDVLPISKFDLSKGSVVFKIYSLTGDKIKPLLEGWPVNYTQDQISFLTLSGREVLVDKTDIWKIETKKVTKSMQKGKLVKNKVSFMDPYPFIHCKNGASKNVIIPQKLFSDAVDVKREFDRLQKGHKELIKFKRRQIFYPKPEVYKNSTMLGLWLMSGARYGASKSRPNNFSPFLHNELSLGAYSYQHLITTGSGPILDGTHAETQTHFYYRMKAEYIHLSLMLDPNLLLVGDQYDWNGEDLAATDFRVNESFFMELGFDIGKFSFEFSPTLSVHSSYKVDGQFYELPNLSVLRAGLRYTGIKSEWNFMAGSGSEELFDTVFSDNSSEFQNVDTRQDFNIFRFNYQRKLNEKQKLVLSYINKSSKGSVMTRSFDSIGDERSTESSSYNYRSNSLSGVFRTRYKRRVFFSALLSVEDVSVRGDVDSALAEDSATYFKFGLNASLKF